MQDVSQSDWKGDRQPHETASPSFDPVSDPLVAGLVELCRVQGISTNATQLTDGLPRAANTALTADLAPLALRQCPVALRFQRDTDGLRPRIGVAEAGIGRQDRRGELLARGHHLAHRVAPQAAVEATQGDLGHGLLVPPALGGTIGLVPALAGSAAAVAGLMQQMTGAVGGFAVGLFRHEGALNLGWLMLGFALCGAFAQWLLHRRLARTH